MFLYINIYIIIIVFFFLYIIIYIIIYYYILSYIIIYIIIYYYILSYIIIYYMYNMFHNAVVEYNIPLPVRNIPMYCNPQKDRTQSTY